MNKGRFILIDRYSREMARKNPEARFVFGDNMQRTGYGGQAKEMRGEPNAIGIVTKRAPSMLDSAFLRDSDLDAVTTIVGDLKKITAALQEGRTVYFPRDGVGTGLAQLPVRAPRINNIIDTFVRTAALAFPVVANRGAP